MPGDRQLPTATPSDYSFIINSHEGRLGALERGHAEIMAEVAKTSTVAEQCVEGVRALDIKMEQLPDRIDSQFRRTLEPFKIRVEEVVATNEEQTNGIAALQQKEGLREHESH